LYWAFPKITSVDYLCFPFDCKGKLSADFFRVLIGNEGNIERQALPCDALLEWQSRIPHNALSFRHPVIGFSLTELRIPRWHLFVPEPPHRGTNQLPYLFPFIPLD
jgi:hypothetical protein